MDPIAPHFSRVWFKMTRATRSPKFLPLEAARSSDAAYLPHDLDFPDRRDSMVLAMYKLEAIAGAMHSAFERGMARNSDNSSSRGSHQPYADFRKRAYSLLRYYIDNDFTDAFKWYLAVKDKSPGRIRIPLERNPFHWGLLAMSAADGDFLSINKLRILASDMCSAHAAGIDESGLELHIRARRKTSREQAAKGTVRVIQAHVEEEPEERW